MDGPWRSRDSLKRCIWIFKAQGVHREALAALRLFYEAARKEETTAELARDLVDYLKKARYHPELRFDL